MTAGLEFAGLLEVWVKVKYTSVLPCLPVHAIGSAYSNRLRAGNMKMESSIFIAKD